MGKVHFSFTVEEAARLLKVHKNTVRRWIKDGLPIIDRHGPAMMRGRDLAGFLEKRRTRSSYLNNAGHFGIA